ncbi:MAG: Oligoribonuclease [Candidatus Collierbacteria bacterium GW2011_GWB1_45_35]|uniref:Oligoribonuclease n=1 Tax=Candidatus Collierbacteria bacterium GW2011_GWB2_45_17 TaxID=1618388 RepID=A0A837IEG0_9BACT|nr:MAG: Oligoribonuclease [Microgenomates group bacterium GW2011_GWC1_44_23]KKT95807.1 MAG: Oligoribonuclease [Candidatus Collierbacteria bacterium GW2011_GWA1_45_15]KKU00249.1 MAG: Oligoribonuclease [Candidatus Collierbacteria bacterium GW2011_GWB2_45_17]KKU05431.1 MAG: Oligoribonuclease [Candidatus Collierbacteria bacterium GW2011_GWB1_45_35]KKU08679.1 MAG: Oligoribonuclease [Candidatus Collierbacteria bacterium GW2011_GWC2_45_40]HCX25305.1 oligoribonuclease [Candidatus Collierbacteria bacte
MSSTLPSSPLIWLDLEFTDLDVNKGVIVEIATVVTDGSLKVLGTGPDLVIHQPESTLTGMARWNREHFSQSGLLEEIRRSSITIAQAEAETLDFLRKYCAPHTALLAGSSIYIDREFLRIYLPKLYDFVHYRIVDTNTIKELLHRWYPNIPDYPKMEPHRAKGDILESIDELKYYQANLFK